MLKCIECDGEMNIPTDFMDGEIVGCPDCGASYEVFRENGVVKIKQAEVEGEDWGE